MYSCILKGMQPLFGRLTDDPKPSCKIFKLFDLAPICSLLKSYRRKNEVSGSGGSLMFFPPSE